MELTTKEKQKIKIDKLKQIENDTYLLQESMEIMNQLITDQENSLDCIEDEITHSSSEVKRGTEDIVIADEYSYIHYYLYTAISFAGASMLYLLL
jgi:t-SNARE complex subunit (syntaxin)